MRHKIGIYVRVSTDEAALRSEGSLETQKHRLLAEIENRNRRESGWGKVVEIYEDDGYSAGTTKRPAYQRAMRDIRSGRINLIFVADYFRLCRNLLDYLLLADELKKISAKVLSIKDNFDTETAMGQSMIRNYINMAQTERELAAERVATNFHARALRGLRNGGRVLFGFERNDQDLARLVVNESEAAEIREIFRVFVDEGTCAKAADRLNQLGILHKTKSYRADGKIRTKKWTRNALQYVLRNPAYAGLREINKRHRNKDQKAIREQDRYQVVKASWPAIVDSEAWQATQSALDFAYARERKRLSLQERRAFLLSGILRCAECQGPLMGASSHGAKAVHRYYVHRHVKGQAVTCTMDWIPAHEVEDAVVHHLDKVLVSQSHLAVIQENLEKLSTARKKDLEQEKQKLGAAIVKIETDIQKTIEIQMQCSEVQVDEVFRDRLRALGENKKAAKRHLDEIEYHLSSSIEPKEARNTIEKNAVKFRQAFAKARPTVQKRLLSDVFDALVLGPTGLDLYYCVDNADAFDIQTFEMKKATDESSVASNFAARGGRYRRLSQERLAPLASGTLSWDQRVAYSPDGENGRGSRI